ncbi:transposase [Roseibium litorale]|uniref:Transposase n=1 Tax=Roseibium litorale TaxID=2803841 RepID=A0ABR9CPB4_9HYPH|nr:transposase [Roseibium litorale]
MTGRERRRRWSDEHKLWILEEVVTSRLSVTEITRRHDVLLQQIYGWRRQFAKGGAPNAYRYNMKRLVQIIQINPA